ncbi:hypothetical protein T492DRAFT_1077589 [Pavlovales sp. CCMP2436]|nr:hypothetical protein T492DRAFT_1077589 [Pavlovales sp. CCMP2436]
MPLRLARRRAHTFSNICSLPERLADQRNGLGLCPRATDDSCFSAKRHHKIDGQVTAYGLEPYSDRQVFAKDTLHLLYDKREKLAATLAEASAATLCAAVWDTFLPHAAKATLPDSGASSERFLPHAAAKETLPDSDAGSLGVPDLPPRARSLTLARARRPGGNRQMDGMARMLRAHAETQPNPVLISLIRERTDREEVLTSMVATALARHTALTAIARTSAPLNSIRPTACAQLAYSSAEEDNGAEADDAERVRPASQLELSFKLRLSRDRCDLERELELATGRVLPHSVKPHSRRLTRERIDREELIELPPSDPDHDHESARHEASPARNHSPAVLARPLDGLISMIPASASEESVTTLSLRRVPIQRSAYQKTL